MELHFLGSLVTETNFFLMNLFAVNLFACIKSVSLNRTLIHDKPFELHLKVALNAKSRLNWIEAAYSVGKVEMLITPFRCQVDDQTIMSFRPFRGRIFTWRLAGFGAAQTISPVPGLRT